MAEAKAIGALVKDGWQPRRTLVYTSWDGEEPGLLGSTEWAEQHAAELKTKAVLYVNSDTNSRGFFQAEGSHALQHFVSEAARDVKDPETGASVLARALAARHVANYESAGGPEAPHGNSNGDLLLGALGSGSDYTPFLQHLGVNSLNLEFGGEADYGVYHSAYDSFDHFRRFVDPTIRIWRGARQSRGPGHAAGEPGGIDAGARNAISRPRYAAMPMSCTSSRDHAQQNPRAQQTARRRCVQIGGGPRQAARGAAARRRSSRT